MAIHPGPRIVLFASDEAFVRELGPVPGHLRVRITTDWGSFERHARTAHVMAVVLPELLGPDFDALVGAGLRFWNRPLVLLTTTDPRNLLQLRHIIAEEVVPWEERQTSFWKILRNVSKSHVRHRIVTHIRRSYHSPSEIIEILQAVLLTDPPLRTVSAVAREFFVVPATLRYRWRKHADGVMLQDLVSWGKLLKGMELRPVLGSWKEVAGALGVDLRTLESYAEKLTDEALEELQRKPPPFALERFHEKVLTKIDWTT